MQYDHSEQHPLQPLDIWVQFHTDIYTCEVVLWKFSLPVRPAKIQSVWYVEAAVQLHVIRHERWHHLAVIFSTFYHVLRTRGFRDVIKFLWNSLVNSA